MSVESSHSKQPQTQERAQDVAKSIKLSRETVIECMCGGRSIFVILFVVAAVIVAGAVSGTWLLSPFALTAWAATGAVSFVVSLIFEFAIKAYR